MSVRNIRRHGQVNSRRPFPLGMVFIVGGVLLLIGVAGIFFFAPGGQAAIEVRGAPALRAAPAARDFGDVQLGQWVEMEVQVTNAGDQVLRFDEKPYVEVVEGC